MAEIIHHSTTRIRSARLYGTAVTNIEHMEAISLTVNPLFELTSIAKHESNAAGVSSFAAQSQRR